MAVTHHSFYLHWQCQYASERRIVNVDERNGLQQIIDEVLEDLALEAGGHIELDEINLAEFCRRTGLSRSRARTIKRHGFKAMPHGRSGVRAKTTVLTGYTEEIDGLLRQGVTNSSICFDRVSGLGYKGSLSTVKSYISRHLFLVPAKRRAVAPQANRGRRFSTKPGEEYQMDWGFVNVVNWEGRRFRIACFAMICHHCGMPYVEFFPNARQENLFIGMIHAFMYLGVPEYVLTDNMKSVVVRRDADGKPVWQGDYAAFMSCVGFKTKLCKPRHPFTKGKVERLVRFVKDNFLPGRSYTDITQLNADALAWCDRQGNRWRRSVDGMSRQRHETACLCQTHPIEYSNELSMYLCPVRKISFDGFVTYEGRRFGVPYWYPSKTCRVSREGRWVHIYSDDLAQELAVHEATWSYQDSACEAQWMEEQPVELPSQHVRTTIAQRRPEVAPDGFARFDFTKETR